MKSLYIAFLALLLTACGDFGLFSPPQAFTEKTLSGSGADKIAIVHVSGILSTLPKQGMLQSQPSIVQETIAQLRLAEKDSSVKAVILVINSPGGSVTASDILYHEIKRIRRSSNKPVYTLMLDVAASGGYYIALASTAIIAHPTTITGSVGVIVTRATVVDALDKIGVKVESTTSGSMKNMGGAFHTPTVEEKKAFQEIVNSMNNRFQALVKENRPNIKEGATYTDGRILTAQQARSMGLIDGIGYFDDVVKRIFADTRLEKAKLITYRRTDLPNGTEYSTPSVKIGEGSLLPESLFVHSGFHYLWLPKSL